MQSHPRTRKHTDTHTLLPTHQPVYRNAHTLAHHRSGVVSICLPPSVLPTLASKVAHAPSCTLYETNLCL